MHGLNAPRKEATLFQHPIVFVKLQGIDSASELQYLSPSVYRDNIRLSRGKGIDRGVIRSSYKFNRFGFVSLITSRRPVHVFPPQT